ncbi:MAG: response regulator transcription factor [Chromatiaceae bacterium]|nr:response regulator transcription factor [Gammaproteobacteria bacterium]MCP5300494.1 response regulator transcription factor [Chromatiaceae bacterium]MCP5422566.1 response regulator transcription factor [Chromatiaceae bacterium]
MALVWLFGPDLSRLAYWSDALHAAAHDAGIVPSSSLSANATVTADVCIYDLGPRRHADIGALLSAVEHHAGPRFVAMSARPDAEEGLALLRGGVRGYVNRMANARVLEAVVEDVVAGEIWAGREVTDHLLKLALSPSAAGPDGGEALLAQLTPREAEVALGVAAGHSNKVIASGHGVSERTVKAQLNSIFRKTGIRNRVQLALALSRNRPNPGRRLSNA